MSVRGPWQVPRCAGPQGLCVAKAAKPLLTITPAPTPTPPPARPPPRPPTHPPSPVPQDVLSAVADAIGSQRAGAGREKLHALTAQLDALMGYANAVAYRIPKQVYQKLSETIAFFS